MGNAGADKYDFTAKQIQKFKIGIFFIKWKMTFRKVTPATKLVNEKKVLASPNDSLACALINFGAFWSMGVHLPSEKSILPYFSSYVYYSCLLKVYHTYCIPATAVFC